MKRNVLAVVVFFFFFLGLFFGSYPIGASTRESIPELKNTAPNDRDTPGDLFDILTELLERSKRNKKPISDIQKFISIATKFSNRPLLMTDDVLAMMYRDYEEYNVLVDFIEKIPIQEPETVIKLFEWVKYFKNLDRTDKVLLTSIFQSLLELFSNASKYASDHYDYDAIIGKMMAIPWNRQDFYDKIFEFFEKELGIKPNKKGFIDFVLEGINNQNLNINNTVFKFIIKDIYRKNINEILQSQEVCDLSTLLEINRLLGQVLERENFPTAVDIGTHILKTFHQLPYGEISHDAPKSMRDRVMAYSKDKLNEELIQLVEKINSNTAISDLKSIVLNIKNNYLLHQLRDYLLALVYAVNAKNPKLRVFLNPNMVRLHDFDDYKDLTPWNYCGPPHSTDYSSKYHLSGGLSRLNIVLATKWNNHLFGRTHVYNSAHVQSLLTNLLDLYPDPMADQSIAYNAVLVDFGLELLRKSLDNETIRKDVIRELRTITSGYHYRKAVHYLTGKSRDHNLFFTEIKQLGERFFKKKKYLDESACKELSVHQPPQFGGIYYHTFGNLIPQQFKIFPQGVSNFFDNGWISGEMIDEFQIKLSWHLYKKNIPPFLLGQVLYSYLNQTAPRVFSQSHVKDYFATYFIVKIFNNSHLSKIIKNLQKKGYLKLK
jgi:hypothetical protein